ncbi:MAG: hypothetical protein FJ279_07015 [Planctomycetes bacterium]|nr:hypothetical protein [Planctomycetota bacterium]
MRLFILSWLVCLPSAAQPAAELRSSGKASVEHASELCFPDARMTAEAWIWPEEKPSGSWMRILSKYGDSAPGLRGWEISINDANRIHFRVVPESPNRDAGWAGLASSREVPVRQWTHVAAVVDGPGQAMRIFLNGRKDAETRIAFSRVQVNDGQPLCVGVFGGYNAHRFKGLMDEVRLTADVVSFEGKPPAAPYTGQEPRTIALYHCDRQEADGLILNAVDPRKHPMSLMDGNLPALSPSMPGFGQALRLTGQDPKFPFKPKTFDPIPHPSLGQIEQMARAWQQRHPNHFRWDVLGKGSDDLPIHLFTITDFAAPDADKEVVLMVAMHSGGERSAATALFAFAEWLISEDALARKIRSRQVCVMAPVPNPWGYVKGIGANKFGHDTAWKWSPQGAVEPEQNPEGVLIQGLMDRLKPEVALDSHGTTLAGQHMGEFIGTSGYSLILNTFQGTIVREMAKAGAAAGFPQVMGAESFEKILTATPVPGAEKQFVVYAGGNAVNAAVYSYIKNHSIPLSMESGSWSGSAVARLKRLMEIGCERWSNEFYPGYPNRRIWPAANYGGMHHLAAYGQTAQTRRESRVELWRKQGQMRTFFAHPEMDGAFLYGVATTREAAKKALAGRDAHRIETGRFLHNIAQIPGVEVEEIKTHLEKTAGASLAVDPEPDYATSSEPIQHGLALRAMIPYAKPRIIEVRLNGHPIGESAVDGYQTWPGDGGTFLQVNVPPAKVGGVAIVTCQYDGQEKREWGFTPKVTGR